MIDKLIELDKQFFLFFNGHNLPWLDTVMYFLTDTFVWVPLYIFLAYFLVKDYQKDVWLVFIGIALTVLLSDQVTSTLMKPYFARLRPSQDPSLDGLVHIVKGYEGGKYGFASSHAANTFGLATFFWMALGKKRRWVLILFLWAVFVAYTRVYLGVHYPGDILAGWLIGILSAIIAFRIMMWTKYKIEKKKSDLSGTQ